MTGCKPVVRATVVRIHHAPPPSTSPEASHDATRRLVLKLIGKYMSPLVIIESPYSGNVDENVRYARECVRDCLLRGESPFASHLLYTQPGVLDDNVPIERKLGMSSGWEWYRNADKCVVYADLGITGGMKDGVRAANEHWVPVETRYIRNGSNKANR